MTEQKKTILVVEDDPANRDLLISVFNEEGYEINSSIDGSDTLELARRHKPGVILMDIQLPNASGKDYIRQLKADDELSQIPVIAVTTQVMRGDEEDIRASGCDEYISKPFEIIHILNVVEKLYRDTTA